MKKYIVCIVCILLLFSGCKANAVQDKAKITPYSQVKEICYSKQEFEIHGIKLSSPQQIASHDDILFICDSGNSRIIKCDLQGNVTGEFGRSGSASIRFVEPVCIDVSPSRICVYDRGTGKIQVLTMDGESIWEYDMKEKFGFLSEIIDVEICGNETVYFSLIAYGKYTGESGIYSLKEGEITKISSCTAGYLTSIANDIYFMSKYELKDDNSWMSGYAEMLKITGNGLERVSAFSDSYSAAGINFFDGKLYTYNFCSQSVEVFSADGSYISTVFAEPVVNDFVYKGFCADKNRNLYLSDSAGNTIYKLVRE